MGDGAGEQQRTVEPGPDLLHECERRLRSGMSPGSRGHGDDAIGALLDRLVGEPIVDDIVEDDSAVGMDGLIDLLTGPQGGDHDRHLVADHLGEVGLEAVVRTMDDEVDRERGGRPLGIGRSERGVGFGDLVEPIGQH